MHNDPWQSRGVRFASWRPAISSRLNRYLGIVSLAGWLIIFLAVISVLTAYVFGWWEFSVMAIVCLATLALCALFLIGRTNYRCELDLARTQVVVGEPAMGSITIENPGSRSILAAELNLPVGRGKATFQIPRLEPSKMHEELFSIPTNRRAILAVGPITAIRGDALGLLRRTTTWAEPQDLYVYPRTVRIDNASNGFLRDLEGRPTTILSSDDMAFHAMREYVPGDDRRHVHWKSSARSDTLMVRQYEETKKSHCTVSLSTSLNEYMDEDSFELAVSTSASLGLQALRGDTELSFVTSSGKQPSATGRQLLQSATRVESQDSTKSLLDLAHLTQRRAPDSSIVFFVTGNEVTGEMLHRAANAIELGVRCFAILCQVGVATKRRTIGDLNIVTVGELNDLPRALRKFS